MVFGMGGSYRHGGAADVAGAEPVEIGEAASPEGAQPKRAQSKGAQRATNPTVRRAAEALAWLAGVAALFSLLMFLTRVDVLSSDPANNALQSWDLLHGNLSLHGWILGDVTFYTFELPLIAASEALFGLSSLAVQVALALIYLTVAACAVAVAVTDARGLSRAARAGVVVAVLAAPILLRSDRWVPLGFPDHTGTTVFTLLSVLLVDRARSRRFTPLLLCLILCAGQLSDVTVRYVAVPAVGLVCLYQALRAPGRRLRGGDAACLAGAVISVPLSLGIRALLLHSGGYQMVTPKTAFAPLSAWPGNLALTWHGLRTLFGQVSGTGATPASTVTAVFGACCMLAVAAGLARVLWRWRSASRAEQMLVVLIVLSIGSYAVSALPEPESQHDIVTVLVAGAVLAARALVPARIGRRALAAVVCAAAATAALLPLSVSAAHAGIPNNGRYPVLTKWLRAHGLRYGLASYWDASVLTVATADQVQVRTVTVTDGNITQYAWEMDSSWYDAATNDANFILIDGKDADLGRAAVRIFGRPASEYTVQGVQVLIYHKNLLKQVGPPPPRSLS
jgi:hypothetical protein